MKLNLAILKPEVRPALRSAITALTSIELILLVPWVKARCSQECMVINCGKLMSEESLSGKIRKPFKKMQLCNYIKCNQ